jgi:hypothetical protein
MFEGMLSEKVLYALFRTIEEDINVFIPGHPWIHQILFRFFFKRADELVP